MTAKSEESDWPRLYREGGPDRKPGHVTRKRLLPWLARLRSPKCASLTRAAVGSILWREVSVSLCRLLTVLSWAGKVRTSKNHIRAPTTRCPERVGRGRLMAGTVGEGREGVLQLGRKQSSFVELVHAFRGLFCNYFASNPSGIRPFPSQCCSPRHLFAPNCAAVSWRGLPRPSSVLRT